MIDPAEIRRADAAQLKLSPREMERLALRIEDDYRAAIAEHDARIRRFQSYYRRWRSLAEQAPAGEDQNPDFQVPLTQWQLSSKWAKEHAALFGADHDIQASPIGPHDQSIARKVSLFMTWAAFKHIKIQNPAAVFDFRKILFGRAHAYSPWKRESYDVPTIDGGYAEQVVYEGPSFEPLWPDDLIVPAEEVDSLHQFTFLIRKLRVTPQALLDGEEDGIYQGIERDWEEILNAAGDKVQRSAESDVIRAEKDRAEGVAYEGSQSTGDVMIALEWYGRWRMLKGKGDAAVNDVRRRERRETELVVRYIPALNKVVGVQRLDEMYPRARNRRPFVESSLVKDGSYWCPGFGEMLERMESELTNNHNLGTKAGQFSVGPVIFYRPGTGFEPDNFTYEPCQTVACDDPSGIKVVELKADLTYTQLKEQAILGYAERATGITDMAMGRAIDRPNAPRTARQTMALLGEGDVRAELEMQALREDWGEILTHFWELYQQYAPEKLFFRVTEDDANGLFDVRKGQAYMTPDELGGQYDFDLKFATSAESRETKKQNDLALYQLDLQNPLIVQNPRALWCLLNRVHKAFGDDRFIDLVPEPPDLGLPKNPKEEWAMALQGEDVPVNPLDNDQLHLLDHNRRIQEARDDENRDEDAYRTMVLHAMAHVQQMQQKMLMQQMMMSLANDIKAGTGGLTMNAGPVDMAQLHEHIGQMLDPSAVPGAAQPGAGKPKPQPRAA